MVCNKRYPIKKNPPTGKEEKIDIISLHTTYYIKNFINLSVIHLKNLIWSKNESN